MAEIPRVDEVTSRFPDDLALAKRAAQGDQEARRILADQLLDRVRATVRYLSADDRDRDDWVQLSMLEVLSSVGTYKGDSPLHAWADRITVRTSLRHLKRRRQRELKVVLDPDARPARPVAPNEEHDRLFVRRRLAQLLADVDVRCRVVLVLKLVHEYTVEEIAEMTDTPRDTVKGRLKRGRRRLREKIKRDPVLMDWARSRT